MFHGDPIQNAVEYIEANLTGSISLYDAARSAGFSVPHFYRIFKALTGDTVGSYVLKRRLSLAAADLCQSRKTVSEIAYEYGFDSHDVFTRAFRRIYGIPPSQYRKHGSAPEYSRLIVRSSPQCDADDRIRFTVVDLRGLAIIGMRCSALEWDADDAIGRLWSVFLDRSEEIMGIAAPATMYGICETGHAEPGRFHYMAAVGVGTGYKIPADMARKVIHAQKYMKAYVPAAVSVPDAYTRTIEHALQSGYVIEESDYIELYEEKFNDPEYNSFVLLIPVS